MTEYIEIKKIEAKIDALAEVVGYEFVTKSDGVLFLQKKVGNENHTVTERNSTTPTN